MHTKSTSVILFLILFACSCDNTGPPIHFLVPEGFRGVVKVEEDRMHGLQAPRSNGTIIIDVPTNGLVVFRDTDFFAHWHKETASYPSGRQLMKDTPPDAADTRLRFLYAQGHNVWLIVGSEHDCEIAVRIDPEKIPLGRDLTETDVPEWRRRTNHIDSVK